MSISTIDLHMHTTLSDGTDTPQEIFANVKQAGIGLFSVTDHDSIKSARIVSALRKEGDPVFIPGVEFSCRDEEGKYHILGYGYDPDAAAIRDIVAYGHRLRLSKLNRRLEHLKQEFHFTFTEKEQEDLAGLDNPGKPHIAALMIAHGYAADIRSAIRDYLNKLHIPSENIRPEDAIRGILGAGGIPVLAHPSYGSGDQLIMGEEMDSRLRRLTAFGLKGLECFYSGFTEKIRNEVLSFAEQYDLYVTAGSDYHGSAKMVELGDTGLEQPYPDGLQRFLQDVRKNEAAEG